MRSNASHLTLVCPFALTPPPLSPGHSWAAPTGVLSVTCQTNRVARFSELCWDVRVESFSCPPPPRPAQTSEEWSGREEWYETRSRWPLVLRAVHGELSQRTASQFLASSAQSSSVSSHTWSLSPSTAREVDVEQKLTSCSYSYLFVHEKISQTWNSHTVSLTHTHTAIQGMNEEEF